MTHPAQVIDDAAPLALATERALAARIIREVLFKESLETITTALSIALFAALTCYDDPRTALEDTYDELANNVDRYVDPVGHAEREAGHSEEAEAEQGTISA